MTRLTLAALVIPALAAGCVVYTDDVPDHPDPGGNPGVVNYAPYVSWADAGCYWDNYYRDDIWYFEAEVDDPDGVYDVVAVYADVYDAWTGQWADSFELFPSSDPYFWFSDWLGSTTYLDCYYGGYLVDIVAYDSFDDVDILTLEPLTYGYY